MACAPHLKAGDTVNVAYKGCSIRATVIMASSNGYSLVIMFDGMLGGYIGMMPLLWCDGEFRDLFEGTAAELRRIS